MRRRLRGLLHCKGHPVPNRIKESKKVSDSAERLVSVARALILRLGADAVSTRLITDEAGMAPSAVNYHLGGLKQLFALVFAEAEHETLLKQRAILADLAALPRKPEALADALAYVIRAWTAGSRDLALLYQESSTFRGEGTWSHAPWAASWGAFFEAYAASSPHREEHAALMRLLFESEALYALSLWRPALEVLALSDLCGSFAALYLDATPRAATGALALAEQQLHAREADPLHGRAKEFAVAAVRLVADQGLAGLTHRAVAAATGATVGAVAHYHPTAETLLSAAIRAQVQLLMERPGALQADGARDVSAQDLIHLIEGFADNAEGRAAVRARRGLFLATMHRPAWATAGATVRFAQGGTMAQLLGRNRDFAHQAQPMASVLSRLISALDQVYPEGTLGQLQHSARLISKPLRALA